MIRDVTTNRGWSNLRPPYQKGEVVLGRGKKGHVQLTSRLKRRLREHPEEADQIVEAFVSGAIKGNVQLIREMFDRIDGRVTEKVESIVHQREYVVTFDVSDDNDDQDADTLSEAAPSDL